MAPRMGPSGCVCGSSGLASLLAARMRVVIPALACARKACGTQGIRQGLRAYFTSADAAARGFG